MGFREGYRRRMDQLTAKDSAAALRGMQYYFADGARWITGAYQTRDGKCLVGAANHVERTSAGLKLSDAKHWIRRAIAERQGAVSPVLGIEMFNDSRASYAEIAEVLTRARQLALENGQQARPALTYQPQEDHRPVLDLARSEFEEVKRR
jgi:hypothetical protein